MPFITQNFLASTIKANGVTLSSSFDYSSLDIETDPKTFFEKTGKQKFGFTQQWGPEANQYEFADLGEDGSGLYKNGFDGPKDLDLENNDPVNVARYTHEQVYSPQDGQGYIDSPQGKLRSPDSAAEKNNFKTSGLDLEDELAGVKQGASGGPNRTNAIQSKKAFQSGDYTVIRAGGLGVGNIAGMNGQGGGVIKQTLHTYTPQNPYFEAGGLNLIPIGSAQNVNSVPFTPKNNIVESNEENGFDATINISVPSRKKSTLPPIQRMIK